MSNVFFTSDEHHGHDNIIKFCNRPFTDTKEMTERLIDNHNSVVKAGDRVYRLGDMFWCTTPLNEAISIVKRLNGQHYYLFGNHCELFKNKELRGCFIWCKDMFNLKVDEYPNIWLSHYAHRVWNGSHRNAWHLYGHTHAALPEDSSLSFDVGVDAQDYFPISLEDVAAKMKTKAELFQFKNWTCLNPDCGNSFKATDVNPENKKCSKCLNRMELR